MKTNKATVAKIRPVSWKVCVAGEGCANYVRSTLYQAGVDCSAPVREPDLQDPAVYSFIATPSADAPLTASELASILERDSAIELAFDA